MAAARISQNLVDFITVYKPVNLDRTAGKNKGFICSLKPVDLLWDPPRLLFNGSPLVAGRTSVRSTLQKVLYFINPLTPEFSFKF
jgi:hypothetical protein